MKVVFENIIETAIIFELLIFEMVFIFEFLITGNISENGQFREVTLRNIALTAPYMHDGRFATLEDAVDHYTSGGKPSPNVSSELTTAPTITTLTAADKADLVAFLHALTDTTYFNKPEWSSPF